MQHFKRISCCFNLHFTVVLIVTILAFTLALFPALSVFAVSTAPDPPPTNSTADRWAPTASCRHAACFLAAPTIALIVIADTAVRAHVCIWQLFFLRVHARRARACAIKSYRTPPPRWFICLFEVCQRGRSAGHLIMASLNLQGAHRPLAAS